MIEPIREHDSDPASAPGVVECFVEIPKGSRNKYEYDATLGRIKLDRFVSGSVVYPTDYGFIPETLSLDGDALDALICVTEPTFPGCTVFARPVALFGMEDEHGIDPHVVCVAVADPGWSRLEGLDDLPQLLTAEVEHFFAIYKDLDPNRRSSVCGWHDRESAVREIDESRKRYVEARVVH